MTLKETIRSYMDSKIIYGEAGEEVNRVGEYGNVLIVERLSGERFPVSVLLVSMDEVSIEQPAYNIEKTIINQPGKKVKKSSPVKPGNTLF